MNRRHLLGIYGEVVGLAILGIWTMLLVTDQVPELETAPLTIYYHLVAEFLTAIALLVTGTGLLAKRNWAFRGYLAALGMLLYTVINSAGYYADLGESSMVGMFAFLTVTTIACLWITLRSDAFVSNELK